MRNFKELRAEISSVCGDTLLLDENFEILLAILLSFEVVLTNLRKFDFMLALLREF